MNADPFVGSDAHAGDAARAPRHVDENDEPVVRLSDSRAQLRDMLDVDREQPDEEDRFPRSKAMRMLTGKPGLIIGAVAIGGLILLRPRLVKNAVRALPTQALWRTLAERFLNRGA